MYLQTLLTFICFLKKTFTTEITSIYKLQQQTQYQFKYARLSRL